LRKREGSPYFNCIRRGGETTIKEGKGEDTSIVFLIEGFFLLGGRREKYGRVCFQWEGGDHTNSGERKWSIALKSLS